MAQDWDLPIGTVTTRAEVSARFGGATYGGIEPSATTPNVMVYSDPSVGRQHGYNFDGWGTDGAFYYTGEGQTGDQREQSRGNQAILKHAEAGRALRVFKTLPAEGNTTGGKPQRYLGEFRIDANDAFRREDAIGTDKEPRTVLVFRLLPIDAEVPAPDEPLADTPQVTTGDEFIPVESNLVHEFYVKAKAGGAAERREARLMADLEQVLGDLGHSVGRLRLRIPHSGAKLLTDTFDATTRALYEVKASSTRNAVRAAIGQLLDYRRFVTPPVDCTVVLPEAPADDLIELVHDLGFGLVAHGTDGKLKRIIAKGETADLS